MFGNIYSAAPESIKRSTFLALGTGLLLLLLLQILEQINIFEQPAAEDKYLMCSWCYLHFSPLVAEAVSLLSK